MKKQARRNRLAAIAAREQRRPTAFVPGSEDGENRDTVRMRLVPPDFDFYSDSAAPGDFCWREVEAPCGEMYRTIWHKLPDGSVGCIPIEPVPMSAKPHWAHGDPPRCHTWQWASGPAEAPNLSPSVHARGRWHGWFRDGQMVSV